MIAGATFRKKWHAPFHGPFDELLQCTECGSYVSATHNYCHNCGHQFNDVEKRLMIEINNRNNITGQNIGVILFLLVFVVFVIALGLLQ
jgi:uncharacterized membrane protein YvbJ